MKTNRINQWITPQSTESIRIIMLMETEEKRKKPSIEIIEFPLVLWPLANNNKSPKQKKMLKIKFMMITLFLKKMLLSTWTFLNVYFHSLLDSAGMNGLYLSCILTHSISSYLFKGLQSRPKFC